MVLPLCEESEDSSRWGWREAWAAVAALGAAGAVGALASGGVAFATAAVGCRP